MQLIATFNKQVGHISIWDMLVYARLLRLIYKKIINRWFNFHLFLEHILSYNSYSQYGNSLYYI